MKRCYYDILQVDSKASSSEIKTSYRKLALKYHPDKNPEADAKERFVQINEAYNVLSDVNERTWYDNNREKILFNKEEMSKEDIEMYSFGFNIWAYFTVRCFKGFDDSEGGFYYVYRDVFEKIKTEETKAYTQRTDLEEDARKMQGFGQSTTQIERVLRFYEDWENFTTYKTFVWSEQYDTRDADNRWMRRQMEKENKKQRQNEKKTYIKIVKDLTAYMKKRDPRYQDYVIHLKEEEERKEIERKEREKEKKKEKEEMKLVRQKLEEERFKEIDEYYNKQNGQQREEKQWNEELMGVAEYRCEICDKDFKSQNQFINHEKSKQHKQAIKEIEKEVMLKEQIAQRIEELRVEEGSEQQKDTQQAKTKKKRKQKKRKEEGKKKDEENQQNEQEDSNPQQIKKEQQKQTHVEKHNKEDKQTNKPSVNKQQLSDSEDDFAAALLGNHKSKDQQRIEELQPEPPKKGKAKKEVRVSADSDQDQQAEEQGQAKLGKAKLKRLKKAQQQKTGKQKPSDFKCNVCSQSFPSKSKLFEHLTKLKHASAK